MQLQISTYKQQHYFFITSLCVFSACFIYLLLRAFYTEPLHDEVATLYHYIESGIYYGPESVLDANNHLLNSITGNWIYKIFGDSFFALRLPNVLSFILYFYGVYSLLSRIRHISLRYTGLFLVTIIPYYLDYFSALRGYGMSLGLLLSGISFLLSYAEKQKSIFLIIALLMIDLAVYANLNMILVVILFHFYIIIHLLIHRDSKSKKELLITIGIQFFSGCLLIPAGLFMLQLKKAGAFYYGGLEGLWINTGRELSYCLLGTEHIAVKWILLIIILLLTLYLFYLFTTFKAKKFFSQPATLTGFLFLGILILVLCLAFVFKINYPSDRTAMHLGVLFYFWILFSLDQSSGKTIYLGYGLILIPFSTLSFFSLHTSVYTPNERMSQEFYKQVYQHTTKGSFISVYETQALTWSHFNRKAPLENNLIYDKEFHPYVDIIINKADYKEFGKTPTGFHKIAFDPIRQHVAYQRNKPTNIRLLEDTILNLTSNNWEFIELHQLSPDDINPDEIYYFRVNGTLISQNPKRAIHLVTSTHDEQGNMIRYNFWNERFSQGMKKELTINFNSTFGKLMPEEKKIKIYIWNPLFENIEAKNVKFEWYKLEK